MQPRDISGKEEKNATNAIPIEPCQDRLDKRYLLSIMLLNKAEKAIRANDYELGLSYFLNALDESIDRLNLTKTFAKKYDPLPPMFFKAISGHNEYLDNQEKPDILKEFGLEIEHLKIYLTCLYQAALCNNRIELIQKIHAVNLELAQTSEPKTVASLLKLRDALEHLKKRDYTFYLLDPEFAPYEKSNQPTDELNEEDEFAPSEKKENPAQKMRFHKIQDQLDARLVHTRKLKNKAKENATKPIAFDCLREILALNVHDFHYRVCLLEEMKNFLTPEQLKAITIENHQLDEKMNPSDNIKTFGLTQEHMDEYITAILFAGCENNKSILEEKLTNAQQKHSIAQGAPRANIEKLIAALTHAKNRDPSFYSIEPPKISASNGFYTPEKKEPEKKEGEKKHDDPSFIDKQDAIKNLLSECNETLKQLEKTLSKKLNLKAQKNLLQEVKNFCDYIIVLLQAKSEKAIFAFLKEVMQLTKNSQDPILKIYLHDIYNVYKRYFEEDLCSEELEEDLEIAIHDEIAILTYSIENEKIHYQIETDDEGLKNQIKTLENRAKQLATENKTSQEEADILFYEAYFKEMANALSQNPKSQSTNFLYIYAYLKLKQAGFNDEKDKTYLNSVKRNLIIFTAPQAELWHFCLDELTIRHQLNFEILSQDLHDRIMNCTVPRDLKLAHKKHFDQTRARLTLPESKQSAGAAGPTKRKLQNPADNEPPPKKLKIDPKFNDTEESNTAISFLQNVGINEAVDYIVNAIDRSPNPPQFLSLCYSLITATVGEDECSRIKKFVGLRTQARLSTHLGLMSAPGGSGSGASSSAQPAKMDLSL